MAKKARDRKRQTKINFSPAAKSSPSAATGATSSRGTASTPSRTSRNDPVSRTRSSSSRAPPPPIDSSSEDELAGGVQRGMSLGMPVKSTQKSIFGEQEQDIASVQTSEEEFSGDHIDTKAKIRSRRRRRDEASSDSDDIAKVTVVKSQKRKRGKQTSESADETPKVTVVKNKRRRRHSPEVVPSEDEELRVPHSKRRKTTKSSDEEELHVPRGKKKKTSNRKSVQEDQSDESDIVEVRTVDSRRHQAARQQSDAEEEEDEAPSRSRRPRIRKRPATPSENEDSEEEQDQDEEEEEDGDDNNAKETDDNDDEEQEDLQEDLAWLRSSPLPDRGKLRSAHEKPKSDRQKALEALKKRRAGSTSEPPSSATPGRGRRVVIESDSDSELEIINEEREPDEDVSDPDDDEDEELSDRDANALDMFLEDEDDENFIDNDADAVIGEPILGPDDVMPLVISRLSSSKPKELFKYAIEWMVMKKIYPGFDSRSEVYGITFQKLDDEVKGLANSKFSSSAWTSDFTKALRARPNLLMMEISRQKKDIMEEHCEACNRRNHPATQELSFMGQPYNAQTLEPLDNDSDSDSNKDSDDEDSELSADSEAELNGEKPTYDAQGSRIPPESETFCLGRTCKANAQVAHTLHHWRYHLYSWVKEHLAREGYLSAEKLVQRDGWTDKKREKAALKIVKKMEESGEIRKLYHLYKDQITYATDARHDDRYQRYRED